MQTSLLINKLKSKHTIIITLVIIVSLLIITTSYTQKEEINNRSNYSERIFHVENVFIDVYQTAYFVCDTSLKDEPYANGKDVLLAHKYEQAILTGINNFTYYRLEKDGVVYYVDKTAITTDYNDIIELHNQTYNKNYTGRVLNAYYGAVNGPSGKETYYNLNMDNIIAIMRRGGNYDVYWIREDGVKMLGDYVMVAAALDIRPRGSHVETSLGMGVVVDTGGFALRNKYQLDIAVDW